MVIVRGSEKAKASVQLGESAQILVTWWTDYYENKKFKYYPDFIIDNNIIEIKSYETDKDLCKYKGVDSSFNLKVLKKNDIEPLIRYVKEKYLVKNLYELYELK